MSPVIPGDRDGAGKGARCQSRETHRNADVSVCGQRSGGRDVQPIRSAGLHGGGGCETCRRRRGDAQCLGRRCCAPADGVECERSRGDCQSPTLLECQCCGRNAKRNPSQDPWRLEKSPLLIHVFDPYSCGRTCAITLLAERASKVTQPSCDWGAASGYSWIFMVSMKEIGRAHV